MGRQAGDTGGPGGSFKQCQGPGELVQSDSCHHSWQGICVPIMSKLCCSQGSPQKKPCELYHPERKSEPPVHGTPASGREPHAAAAPDLPVTGKAGRPQGSSPPDVQPAFRRGDRAERQPGAQMGRINLGAGSSGPRCSVFSRLAGFADVGLGWGRDTHSSRWPHSE